MELINDVFEFLNKLEESFYLAQKNFDDVIRLGEVLTRLVRGVNSEKVESRLHNVKEIEILFRAGDWHEIPDKVKFLLLSD